MKLSDGMNKVKQLELEIKKAKAELSIKSCIIADLPIGLNNTFSTPVWLHNGSKMIISCEGDNYLIGRTRQVREANIDNGEVVTFRKTKKVYRNAETHDVEKVYITLVMV